MEQIQNSFRDVLDYYTESGKLTDLSAYRDEIHNLPSDNENLVAVTQNMIIHDMWLERYGVAFDKSRCLGGSCTMESIFELLYKHTRKNSFATLAMSQKVIACCREFTTMFCALLRAKGIPARARCGFAVYLAHQGSYEDHLVCEVFRNNEWVMVDPQIDAFQLDFIQSWAQKQTDIDISYKNILLQLNPMNITKDDFMVAGQAWQLARQGKKDPNSFGIGANPQHYGLESLSGLWFIRGNLIRDFLALNKLEIDPFLEGIEKRENYWNDWRLMICRDEELTKNDWELLDIIAVLTLNPDKNFQEIRALYEANLDLQPPKSIFSK
jgi:hypothetical protein